jgi:nucleoside phosphorylase
MPDRAFIVALPDEVHHMQEIHGSPVLFCGVGKVNAALGIQELRRMGFDEVVNIGSCGSLLHPVGEIVQVGAVLQDIDCSPLCDYGHTAFETDSERIVLDASLPGTCFTTDYFFDKSQESKYSHHYLHRIRHSSVFDMELFAIAKACSRYGLALQSYKWVSDDGDHAQWLDNCLLSSKKVIDMLVERS